MEFQHFSHKHPLIFHEDQQSSSEGDGQKAYCFGCGKVVSGPSFSCFECRFYLHKKCAEAPSDINHPFHPNHKFSLLPSPPQEGTWLCYICDKLCGNFVYNCSSCGLNLHLDCALFSSNIAQKKFGVVGHIACIDPWFSTQSPSEELKHAKCYVCWKPLLDSVYFSLDCGFFLHKQCTELPLQINHFLHHGHRILSKQKNSLPCLLTLQFNAENLPCILCEETPKRGLLYCCSSCRCALHIECTKKKPTEIPHHPYHRKHPLCLNSNMSDDLPCQNCREIGGDGRDVYCCLTCKFAIHIECMSPPEVIKDESHHEHPFTLFLRQVSFICDACGTEGNCISYVCLTCNLIVHRKCISLPRVITLPRHEYHPIYHTYFLGVEFETMSCKFCKKKVKIDHGSYYCPPCKATFHVKCAIEDYEWYKFYGPKKQVYQSLASITSVIKKRKDGNDVIPTEIIHFSHEHNLILRDEIVDDKRCDGCILFISAPYYHCTQCDFFLHKSCAEARRKAMLWFHRHQIPLTLISDCIFICGVCDIECSGFAYECDEHSCKYICLRCALISYCHTLEGHEHLLYFYQKKKAQCNACGKYSTVAYMCNEYCNFALHDECMKLPHIAHHKSDEHPLKLTYHNSNDYREYHYCDICEEKRDPNIWFYRCAICDTSAHTKCVLENYPFIKPGSTCKEGDHPHKPLLFVQKVYQYPNCDACGKPCVDLALECAETGCNYVVHWKCLNPPLRRKQVTKYTMRNGQDLLPLNGEMSLLPLSPPYSPQNPPIPQQGNEVQQESRDGQQAPREQVPPTPILTSPPDNDFARKTKLQEGYPKPGLFPSTSNQRPVQRKGTGLNIQKKMKETPSDNVTNVDYTTSDDVSRTSKEKYSSENEQVSARLPPPSHPLGVSDWPPSLPRPPPGRKACCNIL